MTRSAPLTLADALAQSWHANGPKAVARVRQDLPAGYLRLVASLVDRAMAAAAATLDGISDQDLEAMLAWLAERSGCCDCQRGPSSGCHPGFERTK